VTLVDFDMVLLFSVKLLVGVERISSFIYAAIGQVDVPCDFLHVMDNSLFGGQVNFFKVVRLG
jgi:hypothetical protein